MKKKSLKDNKIESSITTKEYYAFLITGEMLLMGIPECHMKLAKKLAKSELVSYAKRWFIDLDASVDDEYKEQKVRKIVDRACDTIRRYCAPVM